MRKSLRRLRQTFINLTLRAKLILFFAALMTLVTCIVMAATHFVISDEYEKTVYRSSDLAFSQAQEFTMQTLWPMLYASDTLYYNAQVQQTLGKFSHQPDEGISEQYRDMWSLQNVLYPQNRPMQGICVRLYVDPSYVFAKQNVYFSSLSDLQEIYKRKKDRSWEPYYWLAPEELTLRPNEAPTKVVSLIREIRSLEDFKEQIGIIRVCIDSEKLENIITKADNSQLGVAFFINADREMIAASHYDRLKYLNIESRESYECLTERHVDWEPIFLNNKKYIVRNAEIPETDWEMVALIPFGEIKQPGRRIAAFMAIIMLASIFIAAICVFFFSEWFTKRLRRLARQMINVRNGELDIVMDNDDMDEVGMLYDSFNYMLTEMQRLMKQQYEDGKAIKNAEFKALQAQINPHFLYNTLDLINWKALRNKDGEVSLIAQKLARFYKLSLKSGDDVVTVEDELKHVKTYVEIQNYRFENRILLDIHMPEGLCQNPIPKLIMQPLVENAILHGILKKDGQRNGIIRILGVITGKVVEIRISDDGIGMTQEKLDRILNAKERFGYGYGVKNIDMRLKLAYGDLYGLSYQSAYGAGTAVTIKIPHQNASEEEKTDRQG